MVVWVGGWASLRSWDLRGSKSQPSTDLGESGAEVGTSVIVNSRSYREAGGGDFYFELN